VFFVSYIVANSTVKGKVKFSHTHYWALGPELIPVYRQAEVVGLLSFFQLRNVTVLRPIPSYTAWWQRHIGVNNLLKAVTQFCPSGNWTHDLLISPMPYCNSTAPPNSLAIFSHGSCNCIEFVMILQLCTRFYGRLCCQHSEADTKKWSHLLGIPVGHSTANLRGVYWISWSKRGRIITPICCIFNAQWCGSKYVKRLCSNRIF